MSANNLIHSNWTGKWSNISENGGNIVSGSPVETTRADAQPSNYPGDAVTFARQVLGFNPDPAQADVMSSPSNRILLNCTRQWGKSTTTAALAAWHLITGKPRQTILIVSPSARQSSTTRGKNHDERKYNAKTQRRSPAKPERNRERRERSNRTRSVRRPHHRERAKPCPQIT